MTQLTIKITKRQDGDVVLRCERADGTATWMRNTGAKAQYLAVHDLTHYAVETTLGYNRGFYGLVASGWNLTDFGTPWPRGPLPPGAEPAELVVGFLDTERVGGVLWPAAEFNAKARLHYAERQLANPPVLDDASLARIRAAVDRLRERWFAVPPGGTLELVFPSPVTC